MPETARCSLLIATTKTSPVSVGKRWPLAALVLVLTVAPALRAATQSWHLVANVPYGEEGEHLAIDFYLPDAKGAALPVIVYFHGGGWVKGDKADPRDKSIASDLAGAGYAVANVNYRLGKSVWPRNLEDCRQAVRFVREHAGAYNLDPARMAVMGTSAGAHLALMVGLTEAEYRTAHPLPWPSLRAIVEYYGITDLVTRTKPESNGTPTLVPDDLHANEMLGQTRKQNPSLWSAVSPVNHLSKDEPPIFIAHGLSDPTVDYPQAKELAAELVSRHLPYEMVLIPGAGHMFDMTSWKGKPLSIDLKSHTLDFLDRTVRAAAPGS